MNAWKKCSSCKTEIELGALYYICSVSTCQHKRKGYQFCSVSCWDAHLGYANHKESSALERKAPLSPEVKAETKPEQGQEKGKETLERSRRRIIVDSPIKETLEQKATSIKTETLVVVSKVKKVIKDQSGFNTSQCCIEALTNKVVAECLKGIQRAEEAERKTVMGRDIL